MRKLILLSVFSAVSVVLFAQQDPQFSQNFQNRLFPNPGVAGSNNAICATLLARQQWMGFTGKPETFLFSAHAPVKLLRGGVGLSVYQDKLGQIKDFGFKLAYAYRLNLGIGELGIGLAAGMVSKTVGSSWNAIDNYMLDPSINNNNISKGKFDLDLGLYYKTDKIYLGLSTTHLPQSTFSQAGGAGVNTFDFDFKVVRHYYVMAGYNHQLQSIPLTLQPSVFVKSDASSTIIDINIIALYNNMFWGGVSYRATDAIVPMFGIQKDIGPGTVKFGYSYDVTTSMLKKYNSGTHEIMLGYCFNLPDNSKVQKHKTVRFL